MIELLRANNPGFDRNVLVTLVACIVLFALFVGTLRRLSTLDAFVRRARDGSWPTPEQLGSSRAFEWIAALSVVLTTSAHAQTIAAARALFPKLPAPIHEAGVLAQRMSRSLSGQLNAIAMTNLTLPLVVFAGLVVIVLAVCARQRAHGLRTGARLAQAGDAAAARAWLTHPGPEPVVTLLTVLLPAALTLLPIWHGVHQFVTNFLIALGRVSNLPPGSDRVSFLTDASVDYRALIEPTLAMALVGLAVGTVLAFVLLIRFDPARARRALLPQVASEPSSAITWMMAAVLFAAAALLVQHTVPMRAENRLPWPIPGAGEMRLSLRIATPLLEPTDPAEVGPVLAIDGERLVVDGRPVDRAALESDLTTLKRYWMNLNPGQPFVGGVIVACSPKTPSTRIADALKTAHHAGYPTAWFAFGRMIEHERPLLGTLRVSRTGFARTELGPRAGEQNGDAIAVESYEDCAALSSAIVQARKRGRRVGLLGS